MAISYAGMPWVRPSGGPSGRLPLVLRNPITNNNRFDNLKCGPSVMVKVGPRDYRIWFEGLNTSGKVFPSQIVGGTIPTNFILYATSADGWTIDRSLAEPAVWPLQGTWEQGEVCPDTILTPAQTGDGLWWLFYHGGNNAGPRQVGLMKSPTGLPGTWVRANSGNPILANGGGGAWDESYIADAWVHPVAWNDYRMLYKGVRVSDSKAQIGYASCSDPTGVSWSKGGSNPVLALGGASPELDGVQGGMGYVDGDGRIHLWFVAGETEIHYAYAADWTAAAAGTWTRNNADVIQAPSAVPTDPDDSLGDVVRTCLDEGVILNTAMAQSNTYVDFEGTSCEARAQYWLPQIATSTPQRSARCFPPVASSSRYYMTVPNGAKLLQEATAFSICVVVRMIPGCPGNGTTGGRILYWERAAFNKQVKLFINANGQFDSWYRTPTGIAEIKTATSSPRLDDNRWHVILMRRTGASAFDLYVDGVLYAQSTASPSNDTTTPLLFFNIGGADPADSAEWVTTEAFGGDLILRVVTIAGYAMTPAESLTIFNNGAGDGARPSGGTTKLDLTLGSGGASGPDVDVGPSGFSCTTNAPRVDVAPVQPIPLPYTAVLNMPPQQRY